MSTRERIIRESQALYPELVETRRYFHRNPELSFAEHETARYISRRLGMLGIEHRSGIAGTGIVGFIRGEAPGSGLTAVLRTDMDALPITEAPRSTYSSSIEGVMHACGHDAHMAMMLGSAAILNGMRNAFSGTIMIVFQPGEEKAPGGAKLMIESGIFDSFRPDFVIAQHVTPELPSGAVGFHAGPYMASCDEIYITVAGRGGHAARPSEYTDQIYIASELILALKNTIRKVSRKRAETVFGIGKIKGMGATNVIPDTVEIEGTFRTFDKDWRKEATDIMLEIADKAAAKHGVKIKVNIAEGYPVLVNDVSLTGRAIELARSLLGSEKIHEVPVRMSSEDFSFFAERYPSLLFRLGITRDGEKPRPAHTASFDLDEAAMPTGTAVMTWLALNLLTTR